MKPPYLFFASLFVFLLIAPAFSFATIDTIVGNDSMVKSWQGTKGDTTDHTLGTPNAFTAANNVSIGASDLNNITVTGSGSLDGFVWQNITLPANSGIAWIHVLTEIATSASNDARHQGLWNFTNSAWFDANTTTGSAQKINLTYNFTTNADILKLLDPIDNRTIMLLSHNFGGTSNALRVDFTHVMISYSPPSAPPNNLPRWSANATNMQSPMLYETTNNHGFQITWADSDGNFDNATFQLGRPVGTLTNYTEITGIATKNDSASGAGVWYINFTQDQFGPVGTYNYTWFGVDIVGAQNRSDTVGHVINKAATSMRLWLNGTENNKTYSRNDVANFTARLNVSKTITLTSNYTGFADQSGTQTIFNYTALVTAGNFFNLTGFWNGDENYTGSQKDYLFNATPLSASRTAGETVSFSESPNGAGNMFRSGADKLNILDSYPELQNLFRAQPETVSMADTQNGLRNVFGPVSELVSFSDILNRMANLFRAQVETLNILDSSNKLRGVYQAQNELISLSDIGGRILNLFRANAETITVLDSGGKLRNVYLSQNELVSIGDIAGRILSLFRTQSETVSVIDAASKGQGGVFLLTVPETISIYDSGGNMKNVYLIQSELLNLNSMAGRLLNLFRMQPETINIYDSNDRIRGIYNSQNELLSLSDIGGRLLNLFRAQNEIINIYDSNLKMRGAYQNSSESISIADAQINLRNVFKTQDEILNLYDSFARLSSLFRTGQDTLNIYDSQNRLLNFMRQNGDALQITDSNGRTAFLIRAGDERILIYDSEMRLRSVYLLQSEMINFNDIADRIRSLFSLQGETITVLDSGGKLRNVYQAQDELIGIGDIGSRMANIFRAQQETINFNDIAGRILSLFRAQPETIDIIDSTGKLRSVYQAQNEPIDIGDINSIYRNLYRIGSDLVNLNDVSGRILGLFRTNAETVNINDSGGGERSVFFAGNELVNLYDGFSKARSVYFSQSELITFGDMAGRMLGLFRSALETAGATDSANSIMDFFRARGETINIGDTAGKLRGVYQAQDELIGIYDINSISRNFYRIGSELISFNDIADRIRNLFRLVFENISIYGSIGKQRSLNITSFTAQSSLYQNQYQTFDLTLNNTGQENVSVDYNITVYNSAGSAVSVVQCPAATCPYNLAVGQTLISTTSWFTGSNAVGSYVAQANISYGGASVSRNVSFSIIATPSQPAPSTGGGGSSGASVVPAPVVQSIEPLKKTEQDISSFPVLREILGGDSIAMGFKFTNPHNQTREISVSVNGLPSSWVTISPEKQKISAGSEAVANILISTPPDIAPADYRVEIELFSEELSVSKAFFIMRVKNSPDILNVRPVVNREIKIDKVTNQTEVSIFVKNGKNPVQLTRMTERIPKSLAQSVSDVSFELEPSKVLENDPVVQWDIVFNPGEEDTKIIKYRVKKILDDYSQYVYWNLEQMSVYPYLAGALPFSFKSSANTLAKNQFNPVTIELANDGNVSFDATLSFETPEGWVIIPKEVSRTVKPGESGKFPFEIKPEIAPDGPYTLTLKAVLDRKIYTQQLDFYVTSFKPEQLILPIILALTAVLAAYAIVRARMRRSRPRFSHMLDVIRDR